MTWTGHPRTSTTAWKKLRTQVLKRDRGVCQICSRPGADTVDHIRPASLGGTDDPANLQAVHDNPCHRRKTAAEGTAAKVARRAARLRPVEPHPGLITPPGGQPDKRSTPPHVWLSKTPSASACATFPPRLGSRGPDGNPMPPAAHRGVGSGLLDPSSPPTADLAPASRYGLRTSGVRSPLRTVNGAPNPSDHYHQGRPARQQRRTQWMR